MKVEVKPITLIKKVLHGGNVYDVEQKYDQSRVYVDGNQVGLTMNNPNDRNYMVLHPLSRGYPKEFLELVVKNSGGLLKGTLNGPVPEPEPEETEDDE